MAKRPFTRHTYLVLGVFSSIAELSGFPDHQYLD